MKPFYVVLSALYLAACASPQPASHHPEAPAIGAFRDICLKTAPSFSTAEQVARLHGITELLDAGFARMGFNGDKSLGVQISENKECVVTTPSQQADYLTAQFLQAVASAADTPAARGVPSKVQLAGQTFIVMHDRRGGEAFVVLKADN